MENPKPNNIIQQDWKIIYSKHPNQNKTITNRHKNYIQQNAIKENQENKIETICPKHVLNMS